MQYSEEFKNEVRKSEDSEDEMNHQENQRFVAPNQKIDKDRIEVY